MYYKIINLRTGEYLDGVFCNRGTAEHFIQAYVANQWEKHKKILEQCKYYEPGMNTYMIPHTQQITYKGEPYEMPKDKEYHFQVVEEEVS